MLAPIDNDRFRNLLLSWPGKAIKFLYELYAESLISISERITSDRKASEDIVQETLTLVWENHKLLGQQRDQPIQYYLIKVVKYKSINFYRKKARIEVNKVDYLNGHSNNRIESIETGIISKEKDNSIRLIISTFPRRERECLLLRLDQELSTGEMANRLAISKKAVERSLTSARKRLRKYEASFL